MPIKEKFVKYVELQRTANDYRMRLGSQDIATVEAYQKANELKREVLSEIEDMEYRIESLEK